MISTSPSPQNCFSCLRNDDEVEEGGDGVSGALYAKYSSCSTAILPYSHPYCQLRNLVLYLKLICLDWAIAQDMHVSSMISANFKTRSGCPEHHLAYFDQVTDVGFICLSSHVIKRMYSAVMILEITA